MDKYLYTSVINNTVLMDYLKLHKAVETNKISITELCKKIYITRKTYYNNIENKTLKVETLEKICEVLQLPVTYFFDDKEQKMLMVNEAKQGYEAKKEGNLEHDFINALKELSECRKEKIALLKRISK
jgi:transcriptional regulator with XRE-family HTH domain